MEDGVLRLQCDDLPRNGPIKGQEFLPFNDSPGQGESGESV